MKITVKHSGKTFEKEYDGPVFLIHVLKDLGIYIPAVCNGRGICGKCVVEAHGILSPSTEKERDLFGEKKNFRLACTTKALGDVQIIYNTFVKGMQVLTGGISPDIQIKPDIGTGVAIDIGTTTVAAESFNLATGENIQTFTYENPQRAYGGDVMTRMEFAEKGGLETLKRLINGVIDEIIEKSKAKKVVISGNTAMLHFAAGLSTNNMSKAPFVPESLFGYETGGKYFSPCVSAYFGSDILNGIMAAGMEKNFPSIIADIGTNGEMALFDGQKYYCCSTAAGPCFEGYGIEKGMPAVNSAINRVYIENGSLKYTVMGKEKPEGICGSGLADYAAYLLELGIIDKTGFMAENHYLCENVYITPKDIRNLQLAKAAIRAGIETLLEVSGTRGKIKAFFISGGLGNSVNVNSAVGLGLIPKEFEDISIPAGNTSLSGAAATLLDESYLNKAKETAKKCEVIELADSEIFGEYFIKYMKFGE
ncbi:MAG: DUF4445 domain-containing protein [Clostridiales bacterium]|jgi:uncharacterized 2Fe-2S/4Fe-4S cluster protein (DUF4445 family)|nr:DUF4445 domain-containing protein [Clostridiales bacterium]